MTLYRYILTALSLLLMAVQSVAAGSPRHYATATDILTGHISNARTDTTGYMWFATWNGLLRYDGYKAVCFKPQELSVDGTIDSNRIYNIKNAADGGLWCVTSDNRLLLFDTSSHSFTNISGAIDHINGRKVKTLTPMKNGVTWATFKDGSAIRLVDSDPVGGHRFFTFDGTPNGIFLTANGEEWIATTSGAINYTRGYMVPGNYIAISGRNGWNVLVDSAGNVVTMSPDRRALRSSTTVGKIVHATEIGGYTIVSGERGTYRIDAPRRRVDRLVDVPTQFTGHDSRGRAWVFGRDGSMWMIENLADGIAENLASGNRDTAASGIKNPQPVFETTDGTVVVLPIGGRLMEYDEDTGALNESAIINAATGKPYSISGMKKFLVDDTGNLWIFTDRGVDRISYTTARTRHLENPGGKETRALATDSRGRLWIADRDNTVRVADADGANPLYLTPDGTLSTSPTPLTQAPVYVIKPRADGEMWLGTKGDGLYIVSTAGDKARIEHFRADLDHATLCSDTIYDIVFENDRRAWLASYNTGLSRGDLTDDGWRFSRPEGQPSGLKARQIHLLGNGHLLLATAEGLVEARISDDGAALFTTTRYGADKDSLKGNDVMAIVDSRGEKWLGIFGYGLSRLDRQADASRFDNRPIPADGTADQIKALLATGGDILVVSESKLNRFEPSTGQYSAIPTRRQGDADYIFSEAVPAITADGRIAVGTNHGVMFIDPGRSDLTAAKRGTVITGVRFHNEAEERPMNNPDEIIIEPDHRSFTLSLSKLDFRNDARTEYRYMLEGEEQGWSYTGGDNPKAVFNSLQPGKYTLLIETADEAGWNVDNPTRILIDVKPRFTETTLFKVLLLLALAGAIGLLSYGVIYFKRMRNEIQKKYSLLMTIDRAAASPEKEAAATKDDEKASADRLFLETTARYISEEIDNSGLVVEDLARKTGMSRTAFYNRMKAITGLTPVDFIKQMRIKRALKLLAEGGRSIAETANLAGFTDPKYFARCFKAEMGMTPSQYVESLKDGGETSAH